jgi:nitrate/nitrite-specific signal transduction histidine kinase
LKLPGHHGLGNMEERIAMLGGQFAIESAPGQGACVKVQVLKRVAASQADGLATTTQP